MAAFRSAVAQGVDLIETDVHRTADGVLVLVHDDHLDRTTDVATVFPDRSSTAVADHTWDELQRLDAGSWKGSCFAGERIPSLAQFLDLLQGSRTGLLLEVKDPALYPGIEEEIADVFEAAEQYVEAAVAADKLVVQSFDWDFVRRFHRRLPEVPAGLLAGPGVEPPVEDAAWVATFNPYFEAATPELIARIHELDMRCFPWTVNAEADMRALVAAGADGVITDRPTALNEVLAGV